MNRGETRAAIAELRRADGLQPDTPETLLELGKATAASGELDTAENYFGAYSIRNRPRPWRSPRVSSLLRFFGNRAVYPMRIER
jgi:hypothetical protein